MKLYINQEVPELIRHNPGLDIMFKQEKGCKEDGF